MPVVDIEDATTLAKEHVEVLSRRAGANFVLLEDEVEDVDQG